MGDRVALLIGVLFLAGAGNAGAATRGFVVTAFAPAIYEGDNPCPEGFAESPNVEAFLAKQPRAERAQFLRPENRFDLIKGRRQGGIMYDYYNASMRQGDFTILIELTGVDDAKNDNDVQVGFCVGQDAMINSVDGAVSLTHTSVRVHYDRHYQAVIRGKIVDGVLTTEPVDVLFKSTHESSPYHIRDARFRGQILPDNSLKGILGGYEDIATVYGNLSQRPVGRTADCGLFRSAGSGSR